MCDCPALLDLLLLLLVLENLVLHVQHSQLFTIRAVKHNAETMKQTDNTQSNCFL